MTALAISFCLFSEYYFNFCLNIDNIINLCIKKIFEFHLQFFFFFFQMYIQKFIFTLQNLS